MTVEAEDYGSGVARIEYLVSEAALTKEAVMAREDWQAYSAGSANTPIYGNLTIEAYALVGHADPSCIVRGYNDYACTVCTVATKHEDLGYGDHSWNDPEFTWSEDGKKVTAHFVCSNDESHIQDLDCEVTGAIITPPGCETLGTTRYTATVHWDGKDYSDTKDIADISATGHTYLNGKCTQCGASAPEASTGDAMCLPLWTALMIASLLLTVLLSLYRPKAKKH